MTISPELEASFLQYVGPLWHEIKAGAWHTTPLNNLQPIIEAGEIRPGDTYAGADEAAHAVSVFDFAEANWSAMTEMQRPQWIQFFNGTWRHRLTPHDPACVVAIEIDRRLAPGWRSPVETANIWRRGLETRRPARNIIPHIEVWHDGPLPASAFGRVFEIVGEAGVVKSYRELSIKSSAGTVPPQ